MRLSIVVPVYNVENYLERCVNSLLKQNVDSYEIILVDDGSKDGSGELSDKLATDDRIIVIHQENRGLSGARNTGLKMANGEYVLFVDSDDWLEENSLLYILEEAENLKLDVGVADFQYVDQDGVITENSKKPISCASVISGTEFFKDSMKKKSSLAVVWKSIYRKDFLIGNELYFREGYNHEDEEWTPRVYLKANRVKNIQGVFYNYFIHTDTISKNPKSFEKNSLDLVSNCYELKKVSDEIENEELKQLFQDRIVGLFLSSVYKGKLCNRKHKHLVNSSFFDGMYMSSKNKLKSRIFKFSKKIYCFVNSLMKQI